MRISLSQAAANGSSRQIQPLDEILQRVEDGVHELSFEDIQEIEETEWFRSARPHLKDLTRKLCEAQMWVCAGVEARVVISGPDEIQAARDAAMTPLQVIVENDASDGALVEAAVLAFADQGTLTRWTAGTKVIPPGWEFVHAGGGGEIPRKVRTCPAHPLQGGRRVVVVCDSDRTLATEPDPAKLARYTDATREVGAPDPLMLPLREAENYLPDAFWREWLAEDLERSSYRSAVEALLSLSPRQRDFIDMSGDRRLGGDGTGPLFDGSDPECPKLAPHQLSALSGNRKNLKGDGTNRRTGQSQVVIRQLPDLVRASRVRREDLEQRDREGTLPKLVALIAQEL